MVKEYDEINTVFSQDMLTKIVSCSSKNKNINILKYILTEIKIFRFNKINIMNILDTILFTWKNPNECLRRIKLLSFYINIKEWFFYIVVYAKSNYTIMNMHKFYYTKNNPYFVIMYDNILFNNSCEISPCDIIKYMTKDDKIISMLVLRYYYKYEYKYETFTQKDIEDVLSCNIYVYEKILENPIHTLINGNRIDKICISYFIRNTHILFSIKNTNIYLYYWFYYDLFNDFKYNRFIILKNKILFSIKCFIRKRRELTKINIYHPPCLHSRILPINCSNISKYLFNKIVYYTYNYDRNMYIIYDIVDSINTRNRFNKLKHEFLISKQKEIKWIPYMEIINYL